MSVIDREQLHTVAEKVEKCIGKFVNHVKCYPGDGFRAFVESAFHARTMLDRFLWSEHGIIVIDDCQRIQGKYASYLMIYRPPRHRGAARASIALRQAKMRDWTRPHGSSPADPISTIDQEIRSIIHELGHFMLLGEDWETTYPIPYNGLSHPSPPIHDGMAWHFAFSFLGCMVGEHCFRSREHDGDMCCILPKHHEVAY